MVVAGWTAFGVVSREVVAEVGDGLAVLAGSDRGCFSDRTQVKSSSQHVDSSVRPYKCLFLYKKIIE